MAWTYAWPSSQELEMWNLWKSSCISHEYTQILVSLFSQDVPYSDHLHAQLLGPLQETPAVLEGAAKSHCHVVVPRKRFCRHL